VVNDIEDFGDMPESLLDRVSQILSKKRVLTPRTLNLFLRDDVDHLDVYDCGKLETEDFERIFAHMHHLVSIKLRCAGQMKDQGLRLMIDKCSNLRHVELGALNLISEDAWVELFHQRGAQLETLNLSDLQDCFTDRAGLELVHHCINLKRLKLRRCSHLSETSIQALSNLTNLEHLTLAIAQNETTADTIIDLITKLGPNLKTLCLENYNNDEDSEEDEEEEEEQDEQVEGGIEKPPIDKPNAHDEILLAIREHCQQLRKLRIKGNSHCTDRGFAELFSSWKNKPLIYADFSDCRWIDNNDPEGPQDYPVGFAYDAFESLMEHSGTTLEQLDLKACRHIPHAALTDVFDGEKQYPQLRNIDLSFVSHVDEEVLAGIFRSCPRLSKLAVFACFNATGADLPSHVAVVGLPNAQNSIIMNAFMDDALAKAMA
jgi:DNA repair protein RAD7